MNLKKIKDGSYSDRIVAKRQKLDENESARADSLLEKVKSLESQILTYLDFAKDCTETCYDLSKNGFYVTSRLDVWNMTSDAKERLEPVMLVVMSDGVYHGFGVIGNSAKQRFQGIGNKAGGATGDTLYLSTEQDCVVFRDMSLDSCIENFSPSYSYHSLEDFLSEIIKAEEGWLRNVDAFKKSFYEKVDDLLK